MVASSQGALMAELQCSGGAAMEALLESVLALPAPLAARIGAVAVRGGLSLLRARHPRAACFLPNAAAAAGPFVSRRPSPCWPSAPTSRLIAG